MADRETLVRQRAYEIWESEGSPAGREAQHWDQACRDVDEATAEAVVEETAAPVTADAPPRKRRAAASAGTAPAEVTEPAAKKSRKRSGTAG